MLVSVFIEELLCLYHAILMGSVISQVVLQKTHFKGL